MNNDLTLASQTDKVATRAAATSVSPSVVRTVLMHEWRSVRRNRGVVLFTIGTWLLTEGVLRLTGSAERSLVSLLNLVLFLVPLVSLMLGIIGWHSSREFTELLLTQPVKRTRLFLALYLGQVLPLALGFALAVFFPLAMHRALGPEVAALALATIGSGVALAFVFGGFALLIGVRIDDRLRSVVVGLMLWLLLSVGYDALVLLVSTTFSDYPLERPMLALMLGNPIDLARSVIVLHSDTAALMGYTGAVLKRFLGTPLGTLSAVIGLLLWMSVPAFLARRIFNNRDF